MIRKPNEDLFQETTMTFGEHLEELRTCLFRAIAGIVVGTLLGMYIANDVVQVIKGPLEKALATYYSKTVVDKYRVELENGTKFPYTLEQVQKLVNERSLLFDTVYVSPPLLAAEIEKASPGAFEGVKLPGSDGAKPMDGSDLVPVLFWHAIKDDQRIRIIGLNAQEAFMIWMKAALVVGLVIASPWVFWQVWSFVAAGLYPHEKRYVHLFLPFSIGLFLLGAAIAFIFVFEPVLDFLLSFNRSMGVDPDPRISEWLSFVLLMPLGFGVSFQLPLVMLFLERIGVMTVKTYVEKWRIAILVIAVASMVLTPSGDPYSMLLMGVPLTILYFGGVGLCRWLPKGRNPFE